VQVDKQEAVSVWLFHGPNHSYHKDLWQEADERFDADAAFFLQIHH
jgi:hypothetical protein